MEYYDIRLKVKKSQYDRIKKVSKALGIPIVRITTHALMYEVMRAEMLMKATDLQVALKDVMEMEKEGKKISNDDIYAIFD